MMLYVSKPPFEDHQPLHQHHHQPHLGMRPYGGVSHHSPGHSHGHHHSTRPPRKEPKLQFYKTKMCPFVERGRCTRGASCLFAHSPEELRPLPDLTKTRFCETMRHLGHCTDMACPFAHSASELRHTADFFKTSLCTMWKKGYCPSGEFCRHAHGELELREVPKVPVRYKGTHHRGGGNHHHHMGGGNSHHSSLMAMPPRKAIMEPPLMKAAAKRTPSPSPPTIHPPPITQQQQQPQPQPEISCLPPPVTIRCVDAPCVPHTVGPQEEDRVSMLVAVKRNKTQKRRHAVSNRPLTPPAFCGDEGKAIIEGEEEADDVQQQNPQLMVTMSTNTPSSGSTRSDENGEMAVGVGVGVGSIVPNDHPSVGAAFGGGSGLGVGVGMGMGVTSLSTATTTNSTTSSPSHEIPCPIPDARLPLPSSEAANSPMFTTSCHLNHHTPTGYASPPPPTHTEPLEFMTPMTSVSPHAGSIGGYSAPSPYAYGYSTARSPMGLSLPSFPSPFLAPDPSSIGGYVAGGGAGGGGGQMGGPQGDDGSGGGMGMMPAIDLLRKAQPTHYED
ncbi:unnamed protein product [Vitrella brassicaformis CCMP3155]|uniref:C3H1-type domain-containing protein n=3 Tax=Vitrella brassicaformis TaxID=1169539 RepID=A0A0G4GPK4_VITBC|nr:unnamed protein product [Vitrella brassicaformis CCMP3155]|eukprot:CEM32288.1 unnamed protein product [Vitrella brassicaformis CCMP3155]